jgi:hypothetical protein
LVLVCGAALAGEIAISPIDTTQRLAIAPVTFDSDFSGSWWGSADAAAELVQDRAYQITPGLIGPYGMELVDRGTGLDVAIAEEQLADNPAMDSDSFEKPGQGKGANWLLVAKVLRMTVEDKSEDYSLGGNSYHTEKRLVTVWIQAHITKVGTFVVSPTAVVKRSRTIKIDERIDLNQISLPVGLFGEQRADVVTDTLYGLTDSGITELLGQLLPKLGIKAGLASGYRFDPVTGQSVQGRLACPVCRKVAPQGASFCPYCGAALGRPVEAMPVQTGGQPMYVH